MSAARARERHHLEIDGTPTALRLHVYLFLAYRPVLRARRVESRPQRVEQALARQLEDAQARFARRRLEKRTDLPAEPDDLQRAVDDDAGRPVLLEQDSIHFVVNRPLIPARRVGRRAPRGRDDREPLGREIGRHADVDRRLPVDAPFLVDDREERLLARGFGRPQHQVARGLQRVMEDRHQPLLLRGIEIDQHVAAGDEIEAGEGGIAGQVVPREHTHVAQRLGDLVPGLGLLEEALEPFGRDVGRDGRGVGARPRVLDGALADIAPENLHADAGDAFAERFPECDGDAVGFLAGRASGHPDSERAIGGGALEQLRKDERVQCRERLGLAEETGDVNEQVVRERDQFLPVLAQLPDVVPQIGQPVQGHSPHEAPAYRSGLCIGENRCRSPAAAAGTTPRTARR